AGAPAPAASAPVTGGEFSADRLDLGAMARIASRLPLPAALLKALDEAEPQGRVQGLQARWTGPTEQPSRYQIKAKLSGLSLAAGVPEDVRGFARPGWQGADFDFQADETGGSGRLRVNQGSLTLPGVFEESEVALDRFDGKIVWHVRPRPGRLSELEVLVQEARFANPDGQGEFQARWLTGEGDGVGSGGRYPGQLTLTGRVGRLEATRLARYLPRGLGDDAREYLALAMQGGQLNSLGFKVRGDLWNFPFPAGQDGEFRLVAKVQGLNLAYAPYAPTGAEPGAASRWPALTQLNGEVIIDRASLQIRNAQARLWGLELQGVNGQVRDLMQKSVLVIDGTVRGPLPDMLRFVAESPVGGYLHEALSEAKASGPAELKLGLSVPFIDPGQTTVKGQLNLKGNELRLRPAVPQMSHARGRIDFTQRGFQLSGVVASLLGGEATVEGGSLPDGSLRFDGQGVATAEGLRKAPELGVLARLANRLGGQASYKLQLGFKQGQPELLITSPLVGLSSALPAPLAKAAESSLPLRYQTTVLSGGAAGAALRDQLNLELGSLLKAQYERDLSQDTPRVLRGALALNDALPSALPGTVQASFKVGSLNLDQWHAEAERLSAGDKSAGRSGYEPSDLNLQAQELQKHGRKLTQVSAAVQHRGSADGEHWRLNLASDQAQGLIDYRPAGAMPGTGRLLARMSRLAVPPGEAEAVESLIEQAGASVPALDIVVDDFELRGKKLGKLEVEASYRGSDGSDWRLSKLNLTLPEARLTGSGSWAPGQRRRMALDFNLDIADGGGLLDRLRLGGRSVRGGKGRIQGQLAWNGSPLAPEWSAMTGQMQLALESGQFLRAEPGAARLLGVLSLQSLPRRFLFAFRDVFQEGFAFDNVSGDVQLADGMASTGNLRIRGVQAVVLMEGQANLRQETQDLRVYVVPELNAGTASLAYATINPVIGLGTFLAQLFLRKPLMEAGTREFRIGGSWTDPTVVPVERKRDARMPDLDPPASSASMPALKH
ncbi:YhdP family protein, partial [Ideonella sp.]|uniref:YhdP family protein n=1 Tax=Ideonella sp. TaxID=1929293 RepID=UPI003BB4FAF8